MKDSKKSLKLVKSIKKFAKIIAYILLIVASLIFGVFVSIWLQTYCGLWFAKTL